MRELLQILEPPRVLGKDDRRATAALGQRRLRGRIARVVMPAVDDADRPVGNRRQFQRATGSVNGRSPCWLTSTARRQGVVRDVTGLLAGACHDLRAHWQADAARDHGALHLEQEVDRRGLIDERLEVALALGEDQVGLGEPAAKRRAAVLEDGARRIRTVVDDLDDTGEPGRSRVLQGGVVEDRGTPHGQRDALRADLPDQQPVEHQLPRVIGEVQDAAGPLDGPAQIVDPAAHRLAECLLNGLAHIGLGHVTADAQVDDVAGDGQPDGEIERVFGRCERRFQFLPQTQRHAVEAFLRWPVDVIYADQLAQPPMDDLRERRR